MDAALARLPHESQNSRLSGKPLARTSAAVSTKNDLPESIRLE